MALLGVDLGGTKLAIAIFAKRGEYYIKRKSLWKIAKAMMSENS